MDYTLFPETGCFFNDYMPWDKEGHLYTGKIQFWVMDLTQMQKATREQIDQGLVEWAKAFRATSWDEVNVIENSGVKEAAKTIHMIMSNPTEREMIYMRRDAQNDWRTVLNSEIQDAKIEMTKGLKRDGVDPSVIAKNSGLTLSEIEAL